jgi:hypothetical protein
MREAAEPKKFAQQWKETIAPFEPMIRSTMGGDPIRAAANMFRFAEAMNSAPLPHRAALVAGLIKAHGLDSDEGVKFLAEHLDGRGQQSAPAPVDVGGEVKRQLDALLRGAVAQQSHSALDEFGKDKEFFADVRDDMDLVIQRDRARGIATSHADAYSRACKLHPEISGVLEQREAAKRAATAQAATQRAVAASSSLKPSPAVPVTPGRKKMSEWDAAAAAYDAHVGRSG